MSSLYTVRKLNLPPSAQLDKLARAAGELYSRTVVTYWRLVRKKRVFLSHTNCPLKRYEL